MPRELVLQGKRELGATPPAADPVPAPPAPPRDPGSASAFGEGLQDMATLGFAPRISGLIQAALPVPGDDDSFSARYERWKKAKQADLDAARATRPGAFTAGQAVGGIMSGLALAPVLPAGGAGVVGGAIQGAKTGAILGGAHGFGSTRADINPADWNQTGQVLWDTAKGAAGGAAGGALFGGLAGGVTNSVATGPMQAVADAAESGALSPTRPVINVDGVRWPRAPLPAADPAPTVPEPVAPPQAVPVSPEAAPQAAVAPPEPVPSPAPPPPPQAPAPQPPPAPLPPQVIVSPVGERLPPPPPNTEANVGWVSKAVTGKVEPTKAAKFLLAKGVRLTRGQQDPASPANQLEEALTNTHPHGRVIASQRDQAVADWQNAVINEARAPGAAPISRKGDRWEQLEELYQGFNRAYSKFNGILADKAKIPAVQSDAVASAEAVQGVSDGERQAAVNFVKNEVTRLNSNEPTIGDLIAARSNVRDALRKATKQQQFDRADVLDAAEESLTASINELTPGRAGRELSAIDGKYRDFKVVEYAQGQAGVSQNGFTPSQLGQGVRQALSKGAWARGHSGELWELAAAGREVFQTVTPPTGARTIVLKGMDLPGVPQSVHDWVSGRAVQSANRAAAESVHPPVIGRNVYHK